LPTRCDIARMSLTDTLINKAQKLVATVWLSLLFAPQHSAAQFVEVSAEIQMTSWHSKDSAGQPIEKHNSFRTHCVVGTNTWLIEHDSIINAKETWWFTGSNVVRRWVITKEIPPPHRISGTPVFGVPPIGQHTTNIYDSIDGHPPGGLGVKLPWLAFCSGCFLKRDGRRIPLPITVIEKDEFDCSDRTSVFDDAFGLPKSVEFYTADNHLKCQYQVEQSTNVLGWSFPSHFKMVFYRPNRDGRWEPQGAASGRVTSFREGTKAQIPADLQREIGR